MTNTQHSPWDDYGDDEILGYWDKYREQLQLARSAPDLLSACERTIKWIDASRGNKSTDPDDSYAPQFLFAAIAKAKEATK